jgi:hypothetical protein
MNEEESEVDDDDDDDDDDEEEDSTLVGRRVVDRLVDPAVGDDPFHYQIVVDNHGKPVNGSTTSNSNFQGDDEDGKPERLWKVHRFTRRFLLRCPELLAAQAPVAKSIAAYCSAVGEAITIESLKMSRSSPRLLHHKPQATTQVEGSERPLSSTSSPAAAGPDWEGLASQLERLTTSSSSAVRAAIANSPFLEKVPVYLSSSTASDAKLSPLSGDDDDHQQQRDITLLLTPGARLLGTPAATADGAPSTPPRSGASRGSRLTPTRTPQTQTSLSPARHTPVKALFTSQDPNDAVRLQHYLLLSGAKRKAPTSITRHTEALQTILADLTVARDSLNEATANFKGLQRAGRVSMQARMTVSHNSPENKEEKMDEGHVEIL